MATMLVAAGRTAAAWRCGSSTLAPFNLLSTQTVSQRWSISGSGSQRAVRCGGWGELAGTKTRHAPIPSHALSPCHAGDHFHFQNRFHLLPTQRLACRRRQPRLRAQRARACASSARPLRSAPSLPPSAAAAGHQQRLAWGVGSTPVRTDFDAIVVLAGGLLPDGGLPPWSLRRLDLAASLAALQQPQQAPSPQPSLARPATPGRAEGAAAGVANGSADGSDNGSSRGGDDGGGDGSSGGEAAPGCVVLCSGGGTPHRPTVLSESGYVLFESTSCASYLVGEVRACGSPLFSFVWVFRVPAGGIVFSGVCVVVVRRL